MWKELFNRKEDNNRELRNRPPGFIRKNKPVETQADLDDESNYKSIFCNVQQSVGEHYRLSFDEDHLQNFYDTKEQFRAFIYRGDNWKMNIGSCVQGDILVLRVVGIKGTAIPAMSIVLDIYVTKVKELLSEYNLSKVSGTYSNLNNNINNQFYPASVAAYQSDSFFTSVTITQIDANWTCAIATTL